MSTDQHDYTADVLVAGGGPAGIGAAVAAARNGADVLLVEGANSLGGMASNGLVTTMLRVAGCEGGIVREIWARLEVLDSAHVSGRGAEVNASVFKLAALQIAREAGVRLLLHALAGEAITDGKRVLGARIAGKGGIQSVSARVVVDATGDGDLAASAGAAWEKGREDGSLQAVSLNFELAGVDRSALPTWDEFVKLSGQAIQDGAIDLPPYVKSLHFGREHPFYPAGVTHFQLDLATGVDASDPESLTEGEAVCHERVLQIWRFLKERVPGFEDSAIVNVAAYLGVRETRRIRGERVLCDDDVLSARKFPDGISRGSFYMDVHDGQTKTPEYKASLAPPPGDFYEIPYGCLVPLDLDGLLVCGRCISTTRMANGSIRIQATCMNTGQAAGTAAALCVQRGVRPRDVSGAELRGVLVEQGMEL